MIRFGAIDHFYFQSSNRQTEDSKTLKNCCKSLKTEKTQLNSTQTFTQSKTDQHHKHEDPNQKHLLKIHPKNQKPPKS